MLSITHYLILSSFLLCAGIFIVVTRRHAIMLLMGIELILNAANINLVAFNRFHGTSLYGQIFALMVIVLAACEVVVALAFVLAIYHHQKKINLDQLQDLRE